MVDTYCNIVNNVEPSEFSTHSIPFVNIEPKNLTFPSLDEASTYTYQLVDLGEGWVRNTKSLRCYSI